MPNDLFPKVETVTQMCSVKKVLKEIIKETLAQVSSCEFCEISKNTFFVTLLQRHDMVERRRDVKTITLQRR